MDAGVVCAQLGYSRFNATAIGMGTFGQGTGPIYIDNSACTGTESGLLGCNYDTHTSDCSHDEDAGIRCYTGPLFCETGAIRLVGGTSVNEGRVEVCVNETWGTVCDQMWGVPDANVACRQLGFQPVNATPIYNAMLGAGAGRIWLNNLLCSGSEGRLIDCAHAGLGMSTGCNGHMDDAGVRCIEGCVNGQARLVGGALASEGRVEVCLDQQWGTVCDDSFSSTDASVVCRQLGYSRLNAVAFSSARYGPGTGPIHLDDVACTGMESRITDCTYDSDTSDCLHFEDASVSCTADLLCADGELRLMGGSTDMEGRVEICINETWGTICDGLWSTMDAQVACRSLGFSYMGASAFSSATFGQGTGPIFLDQVTCTGTESSLLECTSSSQPASCQHSDDAGVRCNPTVCQDGDIRLVNSPPGRNNSGRVEVCVGEAWGTVCDDNWSQLDANVACRQLGFSRHNSVARTNAFYGMGTGPINIDEAACTGSEMRLIDCPFDPTHDCTHAEDAGVDCSTTFICQEGSVRLVDGPSAVEGRVEVCINETWSTICDNRWSITDANVVCGQLGHLSRGATAYSNARYGQGSGPIVFNNLICTGSEGSIFDCPNDGFGVIGSCTHADDASVACLESCDSGAIRLVGGTNQYEGRLEICINNVWGTVCDNMWDSTDASIACKQLGYSEHNSTALTSAALGQGSGPIHLVNLQCVGNEDGIANCTYSTDTSSCTHSRDAAVRCRACSNGEIRLAGGTTVNNGRVEICRSQQWGTVCGGTTWETADASVVCRQLGFSGMGALAFTNLFGQGTGPMFLGDVACTGTELNLTDCTSSMNPSCTHAMDAGVVCRTNIVCREGDVRLAGSTNNNEGRVEICRLEEWRTICDNGWGSMEASVVCSQLSFSRRNANTSSGFGPGSGNIYGQQLACTGNEQRLSECTYSMDTTSCTHANDAGVICSITPLCQNGALRIQGGSTPLAGYLEVCYNEVWGSVCDSNWGDMDASVACRQLGFAPVGMRVDGVGFTMGTGAALLNNVQCTGNEQQLQDCASDPLGMPQTCSGQAALMCQQRCVSGSIRIVGESFPWEGRVEVCKSDTWGTVCDDMWNEEDSNVACRQAGFSSQGSTPLSGSMSTFGPGIGPIHLGGLECTGDEDSLFACDNNPTITCTSHSRDAAVRCQRQRICEDGQLRLAGATATVMSGRVEICFNETWGTICDSFWTVNDGRVACRQLGFSKLNADVQRGSFYGPGSGPIHLAGLQCTGLETNITLCPNGSATGCSHQTDAGVACQPRVCENGDVRLVGGSNMFEGRVEMCYNEDWGTICHNGFGRLEAAVVCSQLGFSRIRVTAISDSFFGPGTGPVLLSDLTCRGNETNLLECPTPGPIGGVNCAHTLDASVVCERRQSEPIGVTAGSPTASTMNVTWQTPVEFESNITNYVVTCNTTSGSSRRAVTRTSQQYDIIVMNLQPFTQYNCCVEARYTDNSENAFACATAFTQEGVPGPPQNLSVTYNSRICSDVFLRWDPPAADERNGVIRNYRVRIVDAQTGMDNIRSTDSTSLTVNGLDCCSDYSFSVTASTIDFGTQSPARPFRTMPDLSDPLIIGVNPINTTAINVTWTVPESVHNQGFESLVVSLQSECFTGQSLTPPQTFTFNRNDTTHIAIGSLESFVPYRIRAVATVCGNTLTVYNSTRYTQQAVIQAPVVSEATRFGPNSVALEFEVTPSEQVELEYFEVNFYNRTSDNRNLDLLVGPIRSLRTSESSIVIHTLLTCQRYWVTTTAINCGSSVRSEPALIDVHDPMNFAATLSLGSNGPCSSWILNNLQQKQSDAENFVLGVVNDVCGYTVSCTADNVFTCLANDESKVTLTTTLVSSETVPSAAQVQCLTEWSLGGGTDGRDATIGGVTIPIIANIQSTDGPLTSAPGAGTGLSGWIYAVIAIGIVGIVIVLLLVGVILAVRRRDRPKRDNFHERMLDDMDDVHSVHSIGVVENPLYADHETFDGPTYAQLQKKEVEDTDVDTGEVRTDDLSAALEPTKDDDF